MKKIKTLLTCAIAVCSICTVLSQEDLDSLKWSISAEIGLNASSTNSNYLSFVSPNYSLGLVKSWKREGPFQHGMQLKISVFTETLKNIPYYSLNSDQQLTSTTFTQKNSYPMLSIGWTPRYFLKAEKVFVQGSLGFNFIFHAKYRRKLDSGTSKLSLPIPPKNFLFNRPDVSLGIGFQRNIKKYPIYFVPKYHYNFTIGTGNLIPSFYSFSIEIIYKF